MLLFIGLAGIGGLAYYEWKKKQTAAGTTTVTSSSGTNYISPSPGLTTLPATSQGNTLNPSPISADVAGVVQKWGHTDGRPPVQTMLAAMVPTEYNGMYDIITNYWNKGVAVGQTQQVFWNGLRNKYDPQHISW